ncbi:MAG: GNAT family N-acetyltransferase [Pseudomonadota bacterium]
MGRNHIPGKAPRGLSARIRDATGADAERLAEILNPEIVETTATWTDQTKSEADMATWIEERRALGFPVIVLESEDGSALGYGSYGAFRSWPGYRHTVEHSVYVARDARGLGAGRALIEALERRARSAGMQAMIGGIGSENAESLAIHKRLGFDEVGRLPEVGRKFDRWLTLVLVQKTLRDKAPSPAQKPGGLLRVYDPDYLSWMIRKFFDVFIGRSPAFEPDPGRSAQLAAAALLVEAARSDGEYTTDERAAIDRVLAETYGASVSEAAQLRVEAETAQSAAVGSHRFTAAVKNAMTYEERVELVESLWRVVLSDGERHEAEDALMRKIVGLIYVEDRDSALARRRALEAADGASADG